MKKIHKKIIFWINVANGITLCLFIENLMLKAGRVSEIVYYSNVFNILLWVSGECDGGWPQHLLDNPGWLREREDRGHSPDRSALHCTLIISWPEYPAPDTPDQISEESGNNYCKYLRLDTERQSAAACNIIQEIFFLRNFYSINLHKMWFWL